jgi:hypothetical protein
MNQTGTSLPISISLRKAQRSSGESASRAGGFSNQEMDQERQNRQRGESPASRGGGSGGGFGGGGRSFGGGRRR